jgi:hypothetical protein
MVSVARGVRAVAIGLTRDDELAYGRTGENPSTRSAGRPRSVGLAIRGSGDTGRRPGGAVGLLAAAVGGVERLEGGADVVGDAVGVILSCDVSCIGVCGGGLRPCGAHGRGPRALQGADDDVESAERAATVHDERTLFGVTRWPVADDHLERPGTELRTVGQLDCGSSMRIRRGRIGVGVPLEGIDRCRI